MELEKRAMTEAEDKYTFRQSSQISNQCGLIGHLRADMDTDGNGFFSSWTDCRADLKKDEFKDLVLESYPNAILKPVSYFTDSDRLRFTEKMLRQACSILNEQHNPEIVSEYLLNESLRNYAFFSKSNDWANECEFRVFLPTTKPGYMEIHDVKRCIAGLVIGEKMDASKAYVLQKVRPNIPKRQIVFEASRCILKSFRQILEQEKGDQYVDQ